MENTLMMKLRPASARYGISYDRLRKWCLEGEVAHVRSGRDFLINTRSLEQMLNCSGLKDQGNDPESKTK